MFIRNGVDTSHKSPWFLLVSEIYIYSWSTFALCFMNTSMYSELFVVKGVCINTYSTNLAVSKTYIVIRAFILIDLGSNKDLLREKVQVLNGLVVNQTVTFLCRRSKMKQINDRKLPIIVQFKNSYNV